MNQYMIKGGKPLKGEVVISGAKNAALGILAAALMTDDAVLIDNIPDVKDINLLLDVFSDIGAVVDRIDRHTVRIYAANINTVCVNSDNMRRIRGSYYLLGALLGKYHKAEVVLPGGCNIGMRPIDQHLKGMEMLGAKVDISYGMICASADSLIGEHIYLDLVTVGATINIMLAAVLAQGQTIIENAAKEPHVVDVANFLNSMGARIKGAGTDVIKIVGVDKLRAPKSSYSIIPDQIEAGTFMLAAAATKGDVTIKNVIPKHLEAITAKLREIGADVSEDDDSVRVVARGPLKGTQVKTLVYPGFPTDMQPQITTLLAVSDGTSMVTETIFENRFKYVDELSRMGARIKVEGNTAFIEGVDKLTAATVCAPDLRAGAALVIAGLMTEGYTYVEQVDHIERGYESLEAKFCAIGADMVKVDSEDEDSIRKFKLRAV